MKYLAASITIIVIAASCSTTRKAVSPSDETGTPMAVVFHPNPAPGRFADHASPGKDKETVTGAAAETVEPQAVAVENEFSSFESRQSAKKAHSFAEMKEMVRKKEIQMSKKDQKILAKLDNLYQGEFKNLEAVPFELTTAAKIIGGIGIIALVIALFGSFFFAFIFLLAVAAFILRLDRGDRLLEKTHIN